MSYLSHVGDVKFEQCFEGLSANWTRGLLIANLLGALGAYSKVAAGQDKRIARVVHANHAFRLQLFSFRFLLDAVYFCYIILKRQISLISP